MKSKLAEPITLGAADYDEHGWPVGKITLEFRQWSLALSGPSWVAEIEGLPGYYGEDTTPHGALDRLRQSLGRRPHFRVEHKFRSPGRLKADIVRKYKVLAAAARSRSDGIPNIPGLPRTRGGGSVDIRVKEAGVGKEFVTQARKNLGQAIDPSTEDQLIAGVSKQSLEKTAQIASERCSIELRIAEQTPWRLEHAAARAKFPIKNR